MERLFVYADFDWLGTSAIVGELSFDSVRGNETYLNILLKAAGDYMLSNNRANNIISEVKEAMKSWQTEARRLGIPQRGIDTFAPRIDKWVI